MYEREGLITQVNNMRESEAGGRRFRKKLLNKDRWEVNASSAPGGREAARQQHMGDWI